MFSFLRRAKGRISIGPFIEQTKFLLLQHGYHLDRSDWDDPYLYGYFTGSTKPLLVACSSGRLDSPDTLLVQAWGWEELTTLPQRLFVHRTSELASVGTSDWRRGYEKGILWGALWIGCADREAPEVAHALVAGQQLSESFALVGGEQSLSDLRDAAAYTYQRDWFA